MQQIHRQITFKIFTLVEIMRQCDEKEFCEVLNRLRKAQCTQASDDLFQSCIVDKNSTKYNPHVRHIYIHLEMQQINTMRKFLIKPKSIKRLLNVKTS